jgi:hypothetical protein
MEPLRHPPKRRGHGLSFLAAGLRQDETAGGTRCLRVPNTPAVQRDALRALLNAAQRLK